MHLEKDVASFLLKLAVERYVCSWCHHVAVGVPVGDLLLVRSRSLVAAVKEVVAVDYQHFLRRFPRSRYYISISGLVGLRLSTFVEMNFS